MTQTKDKPFCLENCKTEVIYDSDGDALFFFEEEKVKQALIKLTNSLGCGLSISHCMGCPMWERIEEVFGKSLMPKEKMTKVNEVENGNR